MTDLPRGWITASIGQIAHVIPGQAPPGASYNRDGIGLPLYQGKADFDTTYLRPPRLWTTQPSKVAEAEDILLSVRAPVGPTNLAPAKCAIGRGLAAIRGMPGMEQRYLLYALRWSVRRLEERATGTTFPAITTSVVRDHVLPLAPLAEQKRIVAAIEEQFSRIDAGVDALQRSRANVKRLRAAILRAGVLGRLSLAVGMILKPPIEWNSPASETSQRSGRLWGSGSVPQLTPDERASVPKHWSWKKVADLGWTPADSVQVGPMSMRSADFTERGVPVLNVGAVQWDWIDESKVNYLPPHIAQSFKRYRIASGDVLFTRSGTIGRCAVAGDEHDGWLMTFHLLRVRVDPAKCSPVYLRMVFEGAPHVRRQATGAAIGTTRAGFNTRLLAEIDVPVPPRDEQDAIVASVTDYLRQVDDLGRLIEQQERRSRRLRWAILGAAFAGTLAPHDAADESGSLLIERIESRNPQTGRTATSNGKPRAEAGAA